MKKILLLTVLSTVLLGVGQARAHCEIPCGIYGDEMRFDMMAEHRQTIEKSVREIKRLSKAKQKDLHQIARWVHNKELHAEKIQQIISQYFMHQRIKVVSDPKSKQYQPYLQQLALAHQVAVAAMKNKQAADLSRVESLRQAIENFRVNYLGPGKSGHHH